MDDNKKINDLSDDENGNFFEIPDLGLLDIRDKELVREYEAKQDRENESKSKCISKILDLIKNDGHNTDIKDIEFLIHETCISNDHPERSVFGGTIWNELKEVTHGKDEINLKTRRDISEYIKNFYDPSTSNSTQNDHKISDVEIENLAQLINLYHFAGIFDYIKSNYNIHKNDYTAMAKLFCYLSQTKKNEQFNTIVTHIKNIDNAPKKILSGTGKRKYESICIELNITKREKEHP